MLDGADYVLMESTYGGREHEPSDEAIRLLAEIVREVSSHRGVLLIPAFAVGRTQEIVWQLDRLLSAGDIPHLPLYLDSPMASKASDIYRHHPDYYDEETAALLRSGASPLDYPNQIVTNDVKSSQAIERAPRPYMIVASNGMLTGGRVVGHLRHLIDDPTATILYLPGTSLAQTATPWARPYLRGVGPDGLIVLSGEALLNDPRLTIDAGAEVAPAPQ